MRPFSLTAPASCGLCLFPSFSHIFTLTLPPPPSHPSASLLLNLETPPLSPPPSSHLLSLSFSPATCHRSLSRSSLQTVDPLPSFLHCSLLPVLPDVCPSVEQLLPFLRPCSANFYFSKRGVTYIKKPKSKKQARCYSTACPSQRICKIIRPVMFHHNDVFFRFLLFLIIFLG